jgi:hypothetical protein
VRGDGRPAEDRCPRPAGLVVDDAQWLDAASGECIRFAARRASTRVAFVLAARDPDPEPESDHESDHGLPTVRIGPLPPDSARAVLDRIAPDLAAPVAGALADAAAGVPLVLIELPATLTAGQRTGQEPLDLPLSAGAQVRDVFVRRMAALGVAARSILLLVAADGECDVGVLAAAATGWPLTSLRSMRRRLVASPGCGTAGWGSLTR